MCAQGRIDGATAIRKVTYFAAHPGGVGVGVQGTSVWRCIHFDRKLSNPLMRGKISRMLSCRSYGGAGPVVMMDNLKTSNYPPMDWNERLLKSSPLG